jgi:hypothetical protein
MNRFVVASAIVLIFGSAATTASAQFPTPGLTEQPGPFVREAFASPYGRALIAELGRALRSDADPACLSSKGIAPGQLPSRGEELLIKWWTRATEAAKSLVDFGAYEKAFSGNADLKNLREQSEIKQYLDIERPLWLARLLDFIFEQFDRYNVLNGIKIAAISPTRTGNDELQHANPTEAAEDALDEFIATHKSAQIERFLALSEQAAEAVQGATDRDQAIRMGPDTFFRGMDRDLAELCIGSRR